MRNNKIVDDAFIDRMEAFSLHLKNYMNGWFGGNHRTRIYGNTVEFADYREYQFGDDIRRIDWNLYSRFEKYFIKQFVDERQMHIQIFLDCSASMDYPEKALFAMRVAASLGFLAVDNMDKTSFKIIRGKQADDLCGTMVGKSAFFRGVGELEKVKFFGDSDLSTAVINAHSPGYNDGLVVIISDFMTENNWKKAVDYLLYRKKQILLIQVLMEEELDPRYNGRTFMRDAEALDIMDGRNLKLRITKSHYRAYLAAMADFKEDIKNFATSRGVDFITARSDEPIEKILFNRLYELDVIR
ncbi:MAG: DUF58 domain-containing protein [Firmicutes bacterium]|nr:DUF58 domain-containing protein [Bacillota bacterium]